MLEVSPTKKIKIDEIRIRTYSLKKTVVTKKKKKKYGTARRIVKFLQKNG